MDDTILGRHAATVEAVTADHPLIRGAFLNHRSTRGQPLTFRDKPYLVELYRDLPHLHGKDQGEPDGADVQKGVQTGLSELLVQLVLWRAGWLGQTVGYVLPTSLLRDGFVKRRVDPLLQQVPAYRARMQAGGDTLGPSGPQWEHLTRHRTKIADSLRIKQFGPGTLIFLGSNTPNDFVEFSADCLVVDELDRCTADNLALAHDRLREAPSPQLIRVGNPTLPRRGICAAYDRGDRRRWFVRCTRCNERQPLDWWINMVDRDDAGRWVPRDLRRANDPSAGDLRPVCVRCGRAFERGEEGGCWVAAHPGRRRSYHLDRLILLSQSIRALTREWANAQGDTARLRTFVNSVLGLGYEPDGQRLTVQELDDVAVASALDATGGDRYRAIPVVAGIDVGAWLHVNVSRLGQTNPTDGTDPRVLREAVYVGKVRTFAEVADLLRRFHVDVAVIDARPETRKAQELRDELRDDGGTVVWLCQFHPTDRIGADSYGMRLDYEASLVTVDRTQLLDATTDDLRATPSRRLFPLDVFSVVDWADEMRAPQRVLTPKGDRFVWTEGNQADHFRFADAYDRVASDLFHRGGRFSVV